jgi:hypothetical protein
VKLKIVSWRFPVEQYRQMSMLRIFRKKAHPEITNSLPNKGKKKCTICTLGTAITKT